MLVYGFQLMRNARIDLFYFGMDIACLDELCGLFEKGEGMELPADILVTLKDPLVRKIGDVVAFTTPALNNIIENNCFTEREVKSDDLGKATAPLIEIEKERNSIISVLKNYLTEEPFQMPQVISEMARLKEYPEEIYQNYKNEVQFYTTCDDPNIRLFTSFERLVSDLYNYITNKEQVLVLLKNSA